jgi:hypothetical protein
MGTEKVTFLLKALEAWCSGHTWLWNRGSRFRIPTRVHCEINFNTVMLLFT